MAATIVDFTSSLGPSESEGLSIHHLRGLGVLASAVAVILAGVVGLRAVIAPDHLTFTDALAAAEDSGDPSSVVPTAYGGQLAVTGDREGDFTLTSESGDGSGFSLSGDDGRMRFQGGGEELAIAQFSYDGLEFFPDEGECTSTPGQTNEEIGIAAAVIECADLLDVRDTATITLEGVVGLPADMVVERELPELGGTFTIGDETWDAEPSYLLPPEMMGDDESHRLWIGNAAGDAALSLASDPLVLRAVYLDGEEHAVEAASCSMTRDDLVAVNPEVTIVGMTLRCDEVEVEDVGMLTVEAEVVLEESTGFMPRP